MKKKFSPGQDHLRGLFSGGTLCYEAQVILNRMLPGPVISNAPLEKVNNWTDRESSPQYLLLDLGEEEYTLGRPHPMIDNDLRVRMLAQECQHPEVAVILMDVVIGFGAHSDPAAELGEAVEKARARAEKEGRMVAFIASVTGTQDDPQGLQATTKKLEEAGVIVCRTNAQAARLAGMLVS
jgi:FdrA protein